MASMATNKFQQIRRAFQGLQTLYQMHLPKVESDIIHNLLFRVLNKKSNDTSTLSPFYIVEIRSEEGTSQDKMKNMIFERTDFFLQSTKMVFATLLVQILHLLILHLQL